MDVKEKFRSDLKQFVSGQFRNRVSPPDADDQDVLGEVTDLISALPMMHEEFANGIDQCIRGNGQLLNRPATRAADQRFSELVAELTLELPNMLNHENGLAKVATRVEQTIDSLINSFCTRLADGYQTGAIGEVNDFGSVLHIFRQKQMEDTDLLTEHLLNPQKKHHSTQIHSCKVLERFNFLDAPAQYRRLVPNLVALRSTILGKVQLIRCLRTFRCSITDEGEQEEVRNILGYKKSEILVAAVGPYVLTIVNPDRRVTFRLPTFRHLPLIASVVLAIFLGIGWWNSNHLKGGSNTSPHSQEKEEFGDESRTSVSPKSMDEVRSGIQQAYKNRLHTVEGE